MSKFSLAIHGGAGTLIRGMMTPEKEIAYKNALQNALSKGYEVLKNNGTAIEAVTKVVVEIQRST